MHSKQQFFKTLCGALAIAAAFALMAGMLVIPAFGQNPVPPTARHAATMPQYASRLAHPARPAAGKLRASARTRARRPSPQDGVIYDNGPANGSTDAWTINFGYVVSDNMTLTGQSNTVTGFDFYTWEYPGDTLTSVDWSFTSDPNGGTVYGSGTASGNNITDTYISSNQFGYDIDKVTVTGLNVNVPSGTSWINLQNAVVPSGDPIYWDENSGAGCHSQGCPSQAYESSVGTIPSEAFDIVGSSGGYDGRAPCFEPGGGLQVIHDFAKGEGLFAGVTVDKAGDVYGASLGGGDYGFGSIEQLSPKGQDWTLNTMYSFTGGYNGQSPRLPILGPDGALYGVAAGGIQNCYSQYCGLIYRVRPAPNACRTALCSWTGEVLYRFDLDKDGVALPSFLGFDQAGNLYGLANAGGDYGSGAVFELVPSSAGWSLKVLYSVSNYALFPGTSFLVGRDGNFYGFTSGSNLAVQIARLGNGWGENVIYTFDGGQEDGGGPQNLAQDSSGSLYGTSTWTNCPYGPPCSQAGILFELSPSGDQWNFTQLWFLYHPSRIFPYEDSFQTLAIDAGDGLHGTAQDVLYDGDCLDPSYPCDYFVFGDPGIDFGNHRFNAGAPLRFDAKGNLYGTTYDCGKNNLGTVWELSP